MVHCVYGDIADFAHTALQKRFEIHSWWLTGYETLLVQRQVEPHVVCCQRTVLLAAYCGVQYSWPAALWPSPRNFSLRIAQLITVSIANYWTATHLPTPEGGRLHWPVNQCAKNLTEVATQQLAERAELEPLQSSREPRHQCYGCGCVAYLSQHTDVRYVRTSYRV